MAKTKRRQMAAQAAQAGLNAARYKDLMACPSLGAFRQILEADPTIEVRTQRVIIKIPALPPKPVNTPNSEPTKKAVLGKRRRRKPLIDVDLSSDLIPADEAQISNVILNLRKWKRQKKIDHPPPSVADTVTAIGHSNRDCQYFVGKAKASSVPSNGTLNPSVPKSSVSGRKSKGKASNIPSNGTLNPSVPKLSVSARKSKARASSIPSHGTLNPSVPIPSVSERKSKARAYIIPSIGTLNPSVTKPSVSERKSKAKVSLTAGRKKRVKVQQAPGTPPAEDGKSLELKENMAGEKIHSIKKARSRHKAGNERVNEAADYLVPSDNSSRGILVSATKRSQESAKRCNGHAARTLEHTPPVSQQRRRRSKTVKSQVPVSSKAAVVSQQETRTEVEISISEADAIEVFQKMRHDKTITQQMENFGKALRDDRQLVRSVTDAAALNTHNQREHLIPRLLTRSHVQKAVRSARLGPSSTSRDVQQNAWRTSYQTCSQGDAQRLLLKPHAELHVPSPSGCGHKGLFLLTANLRDHLDVDQSAHFSRQNEITLSGADFLKQENQLSIMKKRLEAAGGLRKWLLDKGLGKFVPILEKSKIDNLTLLQLTMDRLKSMGLLPIGPRRKLIHAISSLTQPSISKSSIVMRS